MDLRKSVLILVTLTSMTACAHRPDETKKFCHIDALPSPNDLLTSDKYTDFFAKMEENGITRDEVVRRISEVKEMKRNPVGASVPLPEAT